MSFVTAAEFWHFPASELHTNSNIWHHYVLSLRTKHGTSNRARAGKTNHCCYLAYCWNTHTRSTTDSVPHETGNRIRRTMNAAPAYSVSVCHQGGSIQDVYSVSDFITLCASWNIRQTIQSCWWPLFTYQTYRCGGEQPDRQCSHY